MPLVRILWAAVAKAASSRSVPNGAFTARIYSSEYSEEPTSERGVWSHPFFGRAVFARVVPGRSLYFGTLVHLKPVGLQESGCFEHVLEFKRFDQKGIGAQGVSAVHVPDCIRRSQNDNTYRSEALLLTYPPQHVEAVDARHFQVEKNEIGQG